MALHTRPETVDPWPALPIAGWDATRASVHMWTQMLGKTRLRLSPNENHWWHVALYVTARGLATSPMPKGGRTLDVELDFLDHRLVARRSDGAIDGFELRAEPVADFHARYRALLRALDFDVPMWPMPSEVADPIRFPDDRVHASYDRAAVARFFTALVQVDRVFKQFRGGFAGKCSPSHFWWGSFDLACTRFSGHRAPPHPGGVPNLPDWVTREAYSHACISIGWWPGMVGANGAPDVEPMLYAYCYPEPAGCAQAPIAPTGAAWNDTLREWVLPWDVVRRAADPVATVRAFADSAYAAAADLAGWDRAGLERTPAVR